MLGKPGNLEAVGLGRLHLFDGIVIKLVGLAARCAVAHQVELAKVHRRPPGDAPLLLLTRTHAVTHAHAGSAIANWALPLQTAALPLQTAALPLQTAALHVATCAGSSNANCGHAHSAMAFFAGTAAGTPAPHLGAPSQGPKSGPQVSAPSQGSKSGPQ